MSEREHREQVKQEIVGLLENTVNGHVAKLIQDDPEEFADRLNRALTALGMRVEALEIQVQKMAGDTSD